MNAGHDTDRRWTMWGRVSIVVIAVATVFLIAATLRVGDSFARAWLLTFTIAGASVAIGWIIVRTYRLRGQIRSGVLHRRYAGAVIVSSVVTPTFARDAKAVGLLLGTNVGVLPLGASLSIVVGSDGMTVFTGSRDPHAVLSIAATAIEKIERNTAFGLDGTPVPGVEFTVIDAGRRLTVRTYVRPAVARLAVQRMRELLA
jgi:hypothetical protein